MEETYSVAELCGELRDLLRQAYGWVWVAGEVQRLRTSQRGHLWFELVEKGSRDEIVARLDSVVWATEHQRIRRILARSGQALAEGLEIRCRGSLDFYPPGGRLQLVVRQVDPAFSLGRLEQRRRETLEVLARAGLLERNRALPLPAVPLRIALITSEESAAYHDFLSGLRESGYGFQVVVLHAAVQGREAERAVASALEAAGGLGVDAAVLIRGGGARSDLAAFDSRRIAEAVARCAVPVLTGLGHETDESIADKVAHTAAKTPTKVAELLVARVSEAETEVARCSAALLTAARRPLESARVGLAAARRELQRSGARVRLARAGLEELAARLRRGAGQRLRLESSALGSVGRRLGRAPLALARQSRRPRELLRRCAVGARSLVRTQRARLEGWERLARQLSPQRTLERGYSITRNDEGRVLRRAGDVRPGDRLSTTLAEGVLESRIEEP